MNDHTQTDSLNRQLVLVTGATGFIGAHIVDNLLRRGLRVRGATRSLAKGEAMLKARPDHAANLSFVQIQDFESPGGLQEAVDGVDLIVHTASVRPQPLIITPEERAILIASWDSHSHTTPQTTRRSSLSQPSTASRPSSKPPPPPRETRSSASSSPPPSPPSSTPTAKRHLTSPTAARIGTRSPTRRRSTPRPPPSSPTAAPRSSPSSRPGSL